MQVPAGSPPCLEPQLQPQLLPSSSNFGPYLGSNTELARLLHSQFPGFQSLYPPVFERSQVDEHVQEERAKKAPPNSFHDLLNDFTVTSPFFSNLPQSPNSTFVFKSPDQSPTPFDDSQEDSSKQLAHAMEVLSAPMLLSGHCDCTQTAFESGIALISENKKLGSSQDYIDLTPYIRLSQEDAAKRLGIPSSTLSKRWREATRNRKWPFRTLSKVEREIKTIVHNLPRGVPIESETAQNLGVLLKLRNDEGRAVFIKKGQLQK